MSYGDRHQNGGSLVELADDRDTTEPANPMTDPWPSVGFASPGGPMLPSSSLFDDDDDLDDFMGDPAGALALAESDPEAAAAAISGWSPPPLVVSSFLPSGLTLGVGRPLVQDPPLPVATETTWSVADSMVDSRGDGMVMASPPEVLDLGDGIESDDVLLGDEVQAAEVQADAVRADDLFEADQAIPAAVVESNDSVHDASSDAPRVVPRPIASFVPLSFGASPASTSVSSDQDVAMSIAPGMDVLTFSPSGLRAAEAASAADTAPAAARRSLFGRGRPAGEATVAKPAKPAKAPKPAKTPRPAKSSKAPKAGPLAESVPALGAEPVIEADHAAVVETATATDITLEPATEPGLETAQGNKQGIASLFAKVDPTDEWKPESPKRAKTIRLLACVSLALGLLIGGYALSQSTTTPSTPTTVAPSADVPVTVAVAAPTATDQLGFDNGGDFSFSEGGDFTVK